MNHSSSSPARWIVVPPFRHDAVWRSAVASAVEMAGLSLHDLDAAAGNAPLNDQSAVIITADAGQAIAAGVSPENVAGLMATGIRLSPDENPDALPHNIQGLTALLGRIGSLPPERIFRPDDFVSGPVEIFPGLKLQQPTIPPASPLSDRQSAVTEAVALLDPEQPQAIWAPALFNYDSRLIPGGAAGQLDLTGRPRFMITGPYIVLPAGRWRATYRLTFDEKGSRPRIRTDWGGTDDYETQEFVPGRAGVFEITQDYDWVEPIPCELRIIVLEGVFDGRMTFSGAEISRVD